MPLQEHAHLSTNRRPQATGDGIQAVLADEAMRRPSLRLLYSSRQAMLNYVHTPPQQAPWQCGSPTTFTVSSPFLTSLPGCVGHEPHFLHLSPRQPAHPRPRPCADAPVVEHRLQQARRLLGRAIGAVLVKGAERAGTRNLLPGAEVAAARLDAVDNGLEVDEVASGAVGRAESRAAAVDAQRAGRGREGGDGGGGGELHGGQCLRACVQEPRRDAPGGSSAYTLAARRTASAPAPSPAPRRPRP